MLTLQLLSFFAINVLLLLSSRRLAAAVADGVAEQALLTLLLGFFWLTTASLLAGLGGFYSLPGMACLLLPWLLAAWRWGAGPSGPSWTTTAWRWLAASRLRWLVLLPQLGFLGYGLRAIAAPPRAYDGLFYHLSRAAFWVQEQGFAPHVWPEAYEPFAFFPPAGDLVWAWTLLGGQGDALLVLAFAAIWALLALSAYVCARQFGIDATRAGLVSAVLMSTPTVLASSGIAYVDNLVAAFGIAALAGLRLAGATADPRRLLLAVMAMGLAALTKFTAMPLLAALAAAATLERWRMPGARTGAGALLRWAAGSLAVLLPLLLWLAWVWTQRQSLTYPFQMGSSAWPAFAGNAELLRIMSEGDDELWLVRLGRTLVVLSLSPINLGYFFLPIVVFALALPPAAQIPVRHWLLLLVLVAVPTLAVLAPANRALVSFDWVHYVGRHLLLPWMVLLLLAARHRSRIIELLLVLAVLLNLMTVAGFLGVSRGELGLIGRTLWPLLPLAVAGGVATASRRWLPDGWRLLAAAAVALSAVPVLGLLVFPERAASRLAFYGDAIHGHSFEYHPIRHRGNNLLLWTYCERRAGGPLVLVASNDWLAYPCFGSRLQNRLEYWSAAQFHAGWTARQAAAGCRLRPDGGLDGAAPICSAPIAIVGHHPGLRAEVEATGRVLVASSRDGYVRIYEPAAPAGAPEPSR